MYMYVSSIHLPMFLRISSLTCIYINPHPLFASFTGGGGFTKFNDACMSFLYPHLGFLRIPNFNAHFFVSLSTSSLYCFLHRTRKFTLGRSFRKMSKMHVCHFYIYAYRFFFTNFNAHFFILLSFIVHNGEDLTKKARHED